MMGNNVIFRGPRGAYFIMRTSKNGKKWQDRLSGPRLRVVIESGATVLPFEGRPGAYE